MSTARTTGLLLTTALLGTAGVTGCGHPQPPTVEVLAGSQSTPAPTAETSGTSDHTETTPAPSTSTKPTSPTRPSDKTSTARTTEPEPSKPDEPDEPARSTIPAPPLETAPMLSYSLSDLGIEDPRAVALTFDDGPGPWTSKVRRVLLDHETPATFFTLGSRVDGPFTDDARRLAATPGLQVASHSWDHAQLTTLSDQQLLEDTVSTRRQVATSLDVPQPVCLRPPYGMLRTDQARLLRQQQDVLSILWDVDSLDWQSDSAQEVADSVVQQVLDGGSIILLHDGGPDRSVTWAALPQIIERLQQLGYHFVDLPCTAS